MAEKNKLIPFSKELENAIQEDADAEQLAAAAL